MIDLFIDLYQHKQIAELKAAVGKEKSETEFVARREAAKEVHELNERMDKLVLAVSAMWSLLTEHTKVTDADLAKRITELDGKDGTLDGKVTARPVKCSCGATVCTKFRRCLFCGKEYREGSPLGAV
jgi:hypothetical protein